MTAILKKKVKKTIDKRTGIPDSRRAKYLKKKHGISIEFFDALLVQQNYVCAICLKPETKPDYHNKRFRRLSIDHAPLTNEIRGLLCADCLLYVHIYERKLITSKDVITYLKR